MRKRLAVLLAGVSASCIVAPAFAQTGQIIDETPPPGTELPTSEPEGADRVDDTGQLAPRNEIVVSARRRAESVQDVPQTVNVVTSAQVEKLNLRSFQEIASVVPGLTLTQTSSFSSQATVRGIAFVPEASGNNPSVAFYLNDAPISSTFLFQSTFDFGQFELQRGPQGTLRGRASPSGAIAVTTRRPDLDNVRAVFNGTITDLHARKVDGSFNIPIISDVLAVRVAGVIDNNRGNRVRTIKEETSPEFNGSPYRRTKSIRGSVRFEPTDWAQFNFMAQQLHTNDRSYGQIASNSLFASGAPQTTRLIRPFDRLSYQDQGSFGRQDHQVYVGNADVQVFGQKLSYVGSYQKQRNVSFSEQDTGDFLSAPRIIVRPRAFGSLAGFDPVCTSEQNGLGFTPTTASYYQCNRNIGRRETHELRLASEERIAGIFDYVIGGFYDKNENPARILQEGGGGGSNNPVVNLATGNVSNPGLRAIIRDGESKERSVFANLTAHLFDDRLELSGGLRYIDFEGVDSPLTLATAPNVIQQPGGAAPIINNETATIYTASVKYKVSDDINVYALTGTSFRPGPRVIGVFSVGPANMGDPSLSPFLNLVSEKSRSYEVGAKTTFLDGRGRFNVSAYYQKFRNYPFRGPSVPYINFQNATAAATVSSFNFVSPVPVTVKGIEGEASFEILDRWSLGLNASYSDGRIKGGTIACADLDRNGMPDVNTATPTIGALQAALAGTGSSVGVCTGVNRRSTTTPKFSANVQSEYGFDIGATTDAFVRGLYTFSGATNAEPENTFDDVSSFGLLNLYAGLRDKDGAWELTVFGKNILRERQVLFVGGSALRATVNTSNPATPSTAPFVSEYRSVSVSAPREFGLTAKIALGSR